ncbi:RNA-binding protein [Ochrobactrum sp. 695/2009]|nr:RNA-binding protein [Ochrobactrum sp. 721/2009]PJT16708.1 RNA-binding protein [Ochrobactrum sp. 720/2009]PJT26530.1 RNA-binding protein [Ochrobactrum sp. 715/2009]PJT28654.1 RNA-binding protein [Ochrobactrum sp. 695/2009]PJT36050.1 RNA-binding protein [Ochrobactrum sp. 689/2009]
MSKLHLSLKAEYFDAIRDGTKTEEYRLANAYWTRRLFVIGHRTTGHRSFNSIVLTKGYPKSDDTSRRIELPWLGFVRKTITHPHFGPDPVEVFAIDVSGHPSGGDRHGE